MGYLTRRVGNHGEIRFGGSRVLISMALCGWQVGLRPTDATRYAVYFGRLCLGRLDVASLSFQCRQGVVSGDDEAAEEVAGA